MHFPTLKAEESFREVLEVFGGYQHKLRTGEGEFYDMKNLTSDAYPVLSPRPPRGVYASPVAPQGMIAKDALCYVDGDTFFIAGHPVEGLTLSTAEADCPKTLVSMGAYVIILPDKVYVNRENLEDYGQIEAVKTIMPSAETTVTFSLCNIDGESYAVSYTQAEEPVYPTNGQYWMDTSTVPHSLKQYSEAMASWVTVTTTYVKIASPGIGTPFSQYDGITVSGIEGEVLSGLNGDFVIWSREDHYLVVVGHLSGTVTVSSQTAPMAFARQMPHMDFVIESENRLWGCRYGPARNGQIVNEIYASKLGDFKNWTCYMGISTDSYTVSLGSDGAFTGAVTHLGHPIFFKEGCMHKIYGNYPANYQLQTTACRGVQKGCHRSLAIVNEILYYKTRSGVCAYDGSLPQEMSSALGQTLYGNAVAGAHGNKYYISMQDAAGAWHLFVYDTMRSLWHREDDTQVEAFCSCGDEMYLIDHRDKRIKTVFGSGNPAETSVSWMAESGIIGCSSPDYKYITRLTMRLMLAKGSRMTVWLQYDSSGVWEESCRLVGRNLQSFPVPIRPRRCDHFRMRFEGDGDAKLLSVAKTMEKGSDVG